ncbi:hypothetical protein JW887_00045 [Candidatus Dojkabacteria bacterium]|nr:hypothetical protein [Candidatus Dojkabacteria bacterium]
MITEQTTTEKITTRERISVPKEESLARKNFLALNWDKSLEELYIPEQEGSDTRILIPGLENLPEYQDLCDPEKNENFIDPTTNRVITLGSYLCNIQQIASTPTFPEFQESLNKGANTMIGNTNIRSVIGRLHEITPEPRDLIEEHPHMYNWVPWEMAIAYGEVIMAQKQGTQKISQIEKITSGDTIIENAREVFSHGYPRKRIEDVLFRQNANPRHQGIKEAISNSIDSLSDREKIGQFGLGVKQLFTWLQPGQGEVVFSSQGNILRARKGYDDKIYIKFDPPETKPREHTQGTSVTVSGINIPPEEIAEILTGIKDQFRYVPEVDINLNGERINGFADMKIVGREKPIDQKGNIDISISSDSVEISDNGQGMNRETMLKLLIPNYGKGVEAVSLDEARKIATEQSDVLFRKEEVSRIVFTRNRESILSIPIPQDRLNLCLSTIGIEMGRIIKVSEGREGFVIDENFVESLPIIVQKVLNSTEIDDQEKTAFLNSLVFGLEQLGTAIKEKDRGDGIVVEFNNIINGADMLNNLIDRSRHKVREASADYIRQLKSKGIMFFPNLSIYGRITGADSINYYLDPYLLRVTGFDTINKLLESQGLAGLGIKDGVTLKNGWKALSADIESDISPDEFMIAMRTGASLSLLRQTMSEVLPVIIDESKKIVIVDQKIWKSVQDEQDPISRAMMKEALEVLMNYIFYTSYNPRDERSVFIATEKPNSTEKKQAEHDLKNKDRTQEDEQENESTQQENTLTPKEYERISTNTDIPIIWSIKDITYYFDRYGILEIYDKDGKQIFRKNITDNLSGNYIHVETQQQFSQTMFRNFAQTDEGMNILANNGERLIIKPDGKVEYKSTDQTIKELIGEQEENKCKIILTREGNVLFASPNIWAIYDTSGNILYKADIRQQQVRYRDSMVKDFGNTSERNMPELSKNSENNIVCIENKVYWIDKEGYHFSVASLERDSIDIIQEYIGDKTISKFLDTICLNGDPYILVELKDNTGLALLDANNPESKMIPIARINDEHPYVISSESQGSSVIRINSTLYELRPEGTKDSMRFQPTTVINPTTSDVLRLTGKVLHPLREIFTENEGEDLAQEAVLISRQVKAGAMIGSIEDLAIQLPQETSRNYENVELLDPTDYYYRDFPDEVMIEIAKLWYPTEWYGSTERKLEQMGWTKDGIPKETFLTSSYSLTFMDAEKYMRFFEEYRKFAMKIKILTEGTADPFLQDWGLQVTEDNRYRVYDIYKEKLREITVRHGCHNFQIDALTESSYLQIEELDPSEYPDPDKVNPQIKLEYINMFRGSNMVLSQEEINEMYAEIYTLFSDKDLLPDSSNRYFNNFLVLQGLPNNTSPEKLFEIYKAKLSTIFFIHGQHPQLTRGQFPEPSDIDTSKWSLAQRRRYVSAIIRPAKGSDDQEDAAAIRLRDDKQFARTFQEKQEPGLWSIRDKRAFLRNLGMAEDCPDTIKNFWNYYKITLQDIESMGHERPKLLPGDIINRRTPFSEFLELKHTWDTDFMKELYETLKETFDLEHMGLEETRPTQLTNDSVAEYLHNLFDQLSPHDQDKFEIKANTIAEKHGVHPSLYSEAFNKFDLTTVDTSRWSTLQIIEYRKLVGSTIDTSGPIRLFPDEISLLSHYIHHEICEYLGYKENDSNFFKQYNLYKLAVIKIDAIQGLEDEQLVAKNQLIQATETASTLSAIYESDKFQSLASRVWNKIKEKQEEQYKREILRYNFFSNISHLADYPNAELTEDLIESFLYSKKAYTLLEETPENIEVIMGIFNQYDQISDRSAVIKLCCEMLANIQDKELFYKQLVRLYSNPTYSIRLQRLITNSGSLGDDIRNATKLDITDPIRPFLLFLTNEAQIIRVRESETETPMVPLLPANIPAELLVYLTLTEGHRTIDAINRRIEELNGVEAAMESLDLTLARNRVRSAILAQAAAPGIDKRELVQNSIYAILKLLRQNRITEGELDIDFYYQDELYVEEIIDNGTGIESTLGYTTAGFEEKDADGIKGFGHFGSGRQKIFEDPSVVKVITTSVVEIDGKKYKKRIIEEPVKSKREGETTATVTGKIIAEVSYTEITEFSTTTTRIQIYRDPNGTIPELDAMISKQTYISMAGLTTSRNILGQELKWYFRDNDGQRELLKLPVQHHTTYDFGNGEKIDFYSSPLPASMTSVGLTMSGLSSATVDYLHGTPEDLKKVLIQEQVSVVLSNEIPLIKDRSRISEEKKYLPYIQACNAAESIKLATYAILREDHRGVYGRIRNMISDDIYSNPNYTRVIGSDQAIEAQEIAEKINKNEILSTQELDFLNTKSGSIPVFILVMMYIEQTNAEGKKDSLIRRFADTQKMAGNTSVSGLIWKGKEPKDTYFDPSYTNRRNMYESQAQMMLNLDLGKLDLLLDLGETVEDVVPLSLVQWEMIPK